MSMSAPETAVARARIGKRPSCLFGQDHRQSISINQIFLIISVEITIRPRLINRIYYWIDVAKL